LKSPVPVTDRGIEKGDAAVAAGMKRRDRQEDTFDVEEEIDPNAHRKTGGELSGKACEVAAQAGTEAALRLAGAIGRGAAAGGAPKEVLDLGQTILQGKRPGGHG
jgi:hypothetical protein